MSTTLIDRYGWVAQVARAIARTPDEKLHVVYYGTNYRLLYAYSNDEGQTWSSPEQISDFGSGRAAIASDSQGNIHIVYSSYGDYAYRVIFYKKKTASGWEEEEAVNIPDYDQTYPVIAIDSQDNIHLVWTGQGLGNNFDVTNIYYRKKEQSGWGSIELVSDESEYQGDWIGADMAIDSNGNIHVAWEGYNKDSWYNLFYRKKSSGKWESIETINDYDLTNTECYSLSIALDSNNNPLIAWEGYDYDSDLAEINYSEKVAGSWQTTTLAESDNAVQPSITLDRKDGIIYIIYQDREAGELRLVKNDGSWGAPQTLYVFSDHKSYGNYGTSALWAKYPNNTNIPYIGFICIFYWATKTNPYTSGVYFYSSSDLSFGPKPPSKPTGLFCNGQTNPSGIKDPTPSFSAIYSDPDGKNSSACEIHVATSQDKLDAPDM